MNIKRVSTYSGIFMTAAIIGGMNPFWIADNIHNPITGPPVERQASIKCAPKELSVESKPNYSDDFGLITPDFDAMLDGMIEDAEQQLSMEDVSADLETISEPEETDSPISYSLQAQSSDDPVTYSLKNQSSVNSMSPYTIREREDRVEDVFTATAKSQQKFSLMVSILTGVIVSLIAKVVEVGAIGTYRLVRGKDND